LKIEEGHWYLIRRWFIWRLIEVRAVSAGGAKFVQYSPRRKRWLAPETGSREWLHARRIRNPGDADLDLLAAAAKSANGTPK
jgi:hypothetical protein